MSSAFSAPILELTDVSFRYASAETVVRGLSLAVHEREIVGILGANGSGKSTILKLAAGMLRPDAGSVTLWNMQLASYAHRDRAKLLSYLPQHLDAGVPFTVREIVGMGLYPYEIPPVMSRDEALDLVGLRDKADSAVTALSGGERRRVFLAMTLLQGAGVLLLDEPLANLDIRYQIEFLKLLGRLKETRGISVVMALHDINLALQFEKVVLLKDGEVLGNGDPAEVLSGEMIRTAFGVDLEVQRRPDGSAYVLHERVF